VRTLKSVAWDEEPFKISSPNLKAYKFSLTMEQSPSPNRHNRTGI